MKITCLGAARCVTGSAFLLDNGHGRFLIDCGLFQGGKQMEELNHEPWPVAPSDISALLLTHAHIDHCGRIPKLVKDGFRGKIYATRPTAELAKILLLDAAHIQEMEAELQTRKNRRRGKPDVAPLYTVSDAQACANLFQAVPLNQALDIAPDLRVAFRNAGHILGSSILEIWSGESEPHKVVFSGDLGHKNQLIVEDPQSIFEADTLFIESTYGNRNHKSLEESKKELLEAIRYSYDHGEKVIIPAFAVERTQEILYVLSQFFRKGLIPSMPVYLDSPLAIAATAIFRQMRDFYDEEARNLVARGQDPFDFKELVLSHTSQDSVAINQTSGPAIVIAGNGMCTAGRIKHHLKHNLWRQGASIVIVGFQAFGTTGRRLVEGDRSIKIYGEKIAVRAKVFTIGGFSAHADQSVLLEWLGYFTNPRLQVCVVHGEENVAEQFAALVRDRLGFSTLVPYLGQQILLAPPPQAVPEKEITLDQRRSILLELAKKASDLQEIFDRMPSDSKTALLESTQDQLRLIARQLDGILAQAGKLSKTNPA